MELQGETSRCYFDDDATDEAKGKLSAIEIATQKLTRKMFELETHKVMIRESGVNLRMKEKEVVELRRKLEDLQYQRWTKMNDFCDRIWTFSAKNDLVTLFNKYLDMPKNTYRKFVAIDNECHPEVVNLRSEVDDLNEQLNNKKSMALKLEEKAFQAKIQLKVIQSYREKNPEVIQMMKNIDRYQEEVTALERQIKALEEEKSRTRKKPYSNPISTQEEIKALKIKIKKMEEKKLRKRPQIFLTPDTKHHFVTASELIAREEEESKDIIKKSKFSVKTESAISKKLGEVRETRLCNR